MKNKYDELLAKIEQSKQHRAIAMPTAESALLQLKEAYDRFKDLGFNDAIYCPKDGSSFEAVEVGCTAVIQGCFYMGEWPKGTWNTPDETGDIWPSRPILFRKKAI